MFRRRHTPTPARQAIPTSAGPHRSPLSIAGALGGIALALSLTGCSANRPLTDGQSEPSSAVAVPDVLPCPDQLRQDLQMQFGEPAVAMSGAELGARLGLAVPDGFACIYIGSSGWVGSTAYSAFYPDADQATADAITAVLAAAGYAQDETGRWAKDGQWGTANAYPAGDGLHYSDYFNDAAMVIFEGSFAD